MSRDRDNEFEYDDIQERQVVKKKKNPPASQGILQNQKPWKHALFDCWDDIPTCEFNY